MHDQVEVMASLGVPQTALARSIEVDGKTLRRWYRAQLDVGAIRANAAVAKALFHQATSDRPQAVTAAIFWLKTRAGWNDDLSSRGR
jgi:hypothetical protein